jgi:hypothetical protein
VRGLFPSAVGGCGNDDDDDDGDDDESNCGSSNIASTSSRGVLIA